MNINKQNHQFSGNDRNAFIFWLLFGLVIAANFIFSNSVQTFFTTHFAPGPFGMSAVTKAMLITLVAYIPLYWLFKHRNRLDTMAEAYETSWLDLLIHGFNDDVTVNQSRRIVFVGFFYFVAIIATWIAYTDQRGI